jgi:AbrB family looped-hinge helix DNA binding protein
MRILGSSRITGKSQVTIPKAVREAVKLEKGDLVVFVDEKDQVVIKKGRVKIEV